MKPETFDKCIIFFYVNINVIKWCKKYKQPYNNISL